MKRIGVLVVAYNAAATLAQVLDRIPRDFAPRIEAVLVADDASQDSTYLVGLGYHQSSRDLPLTVIRRPHNLGYGGNQKAGYRWAIENGLDIVVLLHGDGQYAPELLPQMVEPLELDKCDAVFGSRMMTPGAARRGGMPLYKFVGNRILTWIENTLVGTDLSEWHSGYRAYSVPALESIPFERNSDDFDFDTEIIVQLHEAGKRIEEVPIPTFYGDEISYVNGLKYAKDITKYVLRYRAQKVGFGSDDLAFSKQAYAESTDDDSAHGRVVAWFADRRPSRILDLGCSDGVVAAVLQTHGHEVTGVDAEQHAAAADRMHRFVPADLDAGIPAEVGNGYDIVLAADVLEHVREPEALLADAASRLAPGGSIITSVPNFAHWYPRARVALGRFDYDRRGILDRGHLRFFTRRSFERAAGRVDLRVRRREAVGLPLKVAERGRRPVESPESSPGTKLATAVDKVGVAIWPTLFAYQFLYELEPNAG